MSFSMIASGLALFTAAANAAYTLQTDYMKGGDFWSMWDFETAADPTNGAVQYVDQATAASSSMNRDPLINKNENGSYYMGADHNTTTSGGRPSVRIQSQASYNSGLFVLDLSHMPGGECGSWPAFWLLGYPAEWPAAGEVDIIEGVNNQVGNDMTLHTSAGCNLTNNGDFTADLVQSKIDCNGGDGHDGCQIADSGSSPDSSHSFGSGFNQIGGGVYATEWLEDSFSIWFFPRTDKASIKQATSDYPDPTQWGKPLAKFTFNDQCNVASHFTNQKMIFDLTFCGDWAGATNQPDYGWNLNSCSTNHGDCASFVDSTPDNFVDAFWTINSLRVYQNGASGAGNSSALPGSYSPTAPTISIPAASSVNATNIFSPTSTVYSTTFVTSTASAASVSAADTTTTALPQSSGYDGHHHSHWTIWSEGPNGALQAAATKKARHLDVHRRLAQHHALS
ncbi:MAG: hypothetical protein Q9157_004737 [Trypethelium eluteriae]